MHFFFPFLPPGILLTALQCEIIHNPEAVAVLRVPPPDKACITVNTYWLEGLVEFDALPIEYVCRVLLSL